MASGNITINISVTNQEIVLSQARRIVAEIVFGNILKGQGPREHRFNELRTEGKKLGEINAILEAEGFSEVSGEGVMPCPTKHHEIIRQARSARRHVGWGI